MTTHPASFTPYLNDTITRIAPIIAGHPFTTAQITMSLRQAKATKTWLFRCDHNLAAAVIETDFITTTPRTVTLADWDAALNVFRAKPLIHAVNRASSTNFVGVLDGNPEWKEYPVLGLRIAYREKPTDVESTTNLTLIGFDSSSELATYALTAQDSSIVQVSQRPLTAPLLKEW